jgi:Protein of unknown function (DUF3631)
MIAAAARRGGRMNAAELLARNNIKIENIEPGDYATTCPQCSHKRKPENRSKKCLGVHIDAKGACWCCNHCGWRGPEKGSGDRAEANIERTYDFHDADDKFLFQKVRFQPGAKNRFMCRRREGDKWVWNLRGIDVKPLYNLPVIIRAIEAGNTILLAEGEKDCDNLCRVGFYATTNFDGATDLVKNPKAKPKWRAEYSEMLRGADVVVLNDHDPPGYAHANTAARMLVSVAKRVRRLDLAKHRPEIPHGGDVSDWFAAGHTREELEKLIEGAPEYMPQAQAAGQADAQQATSDTNGDDDSEVERLAKLSVPQYERQRKQVADRLGVRTSILDKLVVAKRAELGLDGDDGKQGHAIEFATPEPWPELVDGAALLDEIAQQIGAHVIMAEHARDATALWVVHTYIIKLFSISPKLFIRSAARGCGKSTLLDVLAHVVVRPMLAANITTATAFRIIEKFRPTLLIDEVDSFLKENEELRGVLNASHRYDGVVPRLVGEDHEPRNFSVYTAIALAGIGGLHATLLDRSVIIDLQRRKASETVASLRIGKTAHLDALVRKILRWVADNDQRIGAAEPAMPAGVINRLADNWHPLLAIADTAASKWPERARAALLQQQGFSKEAEAQSLLELLLADIYEILTPKEKKQKEQISSTLLAELLAEREDRPWAEYGRNEKPITPASAHRRSERGAGAADGDLRGIERHQQLARRVGVGVRGYAGQCHAHLRGEIRRPLDL